MTGHERTFRQASGRIDRRHLLGLTVAAAGAVAVPDPLTTLLSERGASSASSASAASSAGFEAAAPAAGTVPDILSDEIYPIGFFWPPPQAETTQARYDEIAECGINLVLGGNDVVDMPANDAMLRSAAGAGLRALPVDGSRISNAVPCPGWRDNILRTLEQYQAYPAFAGFRIADEPNPVHYPRLRMIADVLKENPPRYLSHFNLVPVYNANADAAYREHLSRFIAQVDPAFVSFDHYPLFTDGTLRATYFLNHMRVRNAGLAAGLPTWVYLQVVDHWNLKRPTRAELAWQINVSLAYGCKGIKYFTYWTPVNRPDFEFGTALIDKAGRRTQLYYDTGDLNRNYLQPVGRELKHRTSESVVHANDSPLPLGAVAFAPTSYLQAVSGNPVILGQFKQDGTTSERWLLVANRSRSAAGSTSLTVGAAVSTVAVFDPATRTYQRIPLTSGRSFQVGLGPGEGRLYQLLPPAEPASSSLR
ncbi:hypothetical protein [Flindersiella endophytica]